MRMRQAIFMSQVRDNSAPKIILGVCWGVCTWLLAIPRQGWVPMVIISDFAEMWLKWSFL